MIIIISAEKAFDRHSNMVLENVREMWTEAFRAATITTTTTIELLLLAIVIVILIIMLL